jgi:hypothetical protein
MSRLTQKQTKRLNSYIEFLDEYSPMYFDGVFNEGTIQIFKFWLKVGKWDTSHKELVNKIESKYQLFLIHKRDSII